MHIYLCINVYGCIWLGGDYDYAAKRGLPVAARTARGANQTARAFGAKPHIAMSLSVYRVMILNSLYI